MKFILCFIGLLHFPLAHAKVVANYTYLKAKKPVQKTIQLKELKNAFNIVKQSTFTPPSPETFFNDFLRFKLGVEVGLHEKSLVKTPSIEKQITNSFLKMAFQQELYKALAELKLKKQMKKLDLTAANLSKKTLKNLYAKEPSFNIFFIATNHPINPSKAQIQEAKKRAKKIWKQVNKSKKPFVELVALYSDDKSNGTLGINRSKASIFPEAYSVLKNMKNDSISKPIRVVNGYVIVKLNKKVPFAEVSKESIKANYFNKSRATIFNNYFDDLKKDFKVNIINRSLVKTL